MNQDQALAMPVAGVDAPRRSLRSFVLRQGRASAAQQRAYEELLPTFGVAYQQIALDLDAVFGRTGEKHLEIGFGMGETTARIAAAHPDHDYLAIEVHTPGVGALLKTIAEQAIRNIRVVQHDAVEVLNNMIEPETFNGAHIFFPDPWPKKRHHKRRLIQAPFVGLLVNKLKSGGYLHVATDWEQYAEQIVSVLSMEPALQNTAANYAPRPNYRPLTKFEARGLRLGHGIWDIVFRKK
ncbi:MAG: tRNA (guanosine(46)-N7)-methyltransferase TrmB [Pseudomonadota bacterium]|nr:tRNA (guanosine(46)-N7)-methyltransferase TrmB [Pseudomonadota bacterium]